MSSCQGCYHDKREKDNEDRLYCSACIRNPEYPSKRGPEEVRIGNQMIRVPQDMYISKERKSLEERLRRENVWTVSASSNQVASNLNYPFPYSTDTGGP